VLRDVCRRLALERKSTGISTPTACTDLLGIVVGFVADGSRTSLAFELYNE
jgi:hypothetical protein